MNKGKIFTITIFSLMCFCNLYSQTYQWRLLTNSPGTSGQSRFEDAYFVNPNTGWVINYDAEVHKTTNAGNNWSLIFESTFGNQLRSIGFFDANTGMLGTLINDSTKVLYRTTNGGSNWTAINNFTGGRRPQGVCGISIVNENIAYACGRYYGTGRIIKTTDKGISWNVVFSDSSVARTLIDCYFWSADSGIAVGGYNTTNFINGNAVVLRTTNGGSTWQRVHKTIRTGEWCWKISFVSRDIGFVSIERSEGFSYILKTTNNGVNWTEIPFMEYDEEGIGFVNENTGWVGGWTGPTYQTTNSGATWQLAGWGTNVNRFRFFGDTLGYAVGDRVYKYSRGPVGIQSLSNTIPETFSLSQNYPNPFNPVTKIKFDITRDARRETQEVRLIVYDALGKDVEALVNEKLSPGSYETEFDGSNFSSGIYFYRLQSGNFTDVKRMILLK
ncbi:MAG: T9SS type A sorting domain-containing protein [Bacteroidota bacterium]|nr:T9SS type A sorting domain-containing protein [Bacteroidota bacterium]